MTTTFAEIVGARRPRVENRPPTIVDESVGPRAVALAALAGQDSEPWQCDALGLMLSRRADGKWACREYGEIVGRQQGKTVGIGVPRALAGLFLLDERLIVWSAHQYKTAQESFMIMRDALYQLGEPDGMNKIALDDGRILCKINNTNGEEGFSLSTGQRLRFVARSKSSGRGFSGDCNLIDEAFAYTRAQQSALAPTLLARMNKTPGGVQNIYLSSPPLDGLSGEVLFALRARAEAGDDRLGWRDWGLDISLDEVLDMSKREREAFLDDHANWAATLPALGGPRVDVEAVDQLRRELDDEGFAREVLGCWPKRVEDAERAIDLELWKANADPDSTPVGGIVLGIDASPGGRSAAILSAGRRADGRMHTRVLDYHARTGWVIERVLDLVARHSVRKIVLDPTGPVGALLAGLTTALEGTGVEIEPISGQEMGRACGAFVADLVEDAFRHCGDDALDDAVEVATTRESGDGFRWSRKDSTADICPLVAATVATQGFRLHGAEPEAEEPWAVYA